MTESRRNTMAWMALAGLLVIMCIRMTIPEPIGDGVWSSTVAFLRVGTSTMGNLTGPAEVMGLGILTLLACGISALAAGSISVGKWMQLGIIAAVLAAAIVAIFNAANRFAALVGVFDLGMALLAGWSAQVLCHTHRRRRLVIAVLVGLLFAVTLKGIYQRYVEIPQTIHYFQKHQQQWLKQSGVHGNSTEVKLFISRLKSGEVSGFGILSDGFAETLIPLLLAGLALAMAGFLSKDVAAASTVEKRTGKATAVIKPGRPGDVNLPDHIVLGAVLLLVSLAGIAVLIFTGSKGGAASFAICAIFLTWACWKRKWLSAHRRMAIGAALVLAAIGTLSLLVYGFSHHGLPTKDLLYRWDYWTGAERMIQHHPLTGVGLNNFGYYYTQYKPPSAPEDVKDPHNMFIRIAAEAGLPAALGFVVLVLWGFINTVRAQQVPSDQDDQRALPVAALIIFALVWWAGRLALNHPGFGTKGVATYQLALSALYAGAAVGGMLLTNRMLRVIYPQYRIVVANAAVLGAAGMVLYDQINMALATGPAAMFFWIILGTFAAQSAENQRAGKNSSIAPADTPRAFAGIIVGGTLCVSAIVLAIVIWIPTVRGTLPWDPSTYRHAFKQAVSTHDWPAALKAADAVLARNTRSQGWLQRKIGVEMQMGINARGDVLKLLSINRTDARVRLPYAETRRAGLTVAQRIAQLKLALQLNSALAKNELQRLSPKEVAEIQAEIKKLNAQMPVR
ncbi:MAG: O-antigen ligase family protein [Phycisphaerae bacterium]